jgi:hypothetical protein
VSPENTAKELIKCKGSQFDPELVDVFISILTIGAYAGDKMYSFIIENDKRLVSIETILRAHDPTRLVSREEVKEMEGRIIRVINELKMRFQVHEDFNSGK